MIKTRLLNGKTAYYDSLTGVNITSIKSVSFVGHPDMIVTVVYKDSVPFVYLPMREGNPLVKLQDAVERMELNIVKVA